MPSRIIRSDADFDVLGRTLSQLKRPFTVQWKAGADRTLPQNNTVWKWAGEVAAHFGDRTAKEVQHEWKLTIGVPILRSEDADFRAFYDRALKGLTYELRLAAMEYVPVTSIMTVPQMTAFMETIIRQGAEQGIRLTIPEDN